MRDISLRWGLGMGVLSAAIGTGALLLGAIIEPFQKVTTADAVALALFVRGMLVLISLGIALGLAYYAGLRVARAYFQSEIASADSPEAATNTAIASLLGVPINRRYTMLAGGLTMFCYWLITSMYIYVLPPTDQSVAPQGNLLNFIETRLLLGLIYVIFGLGLGGLGGRAPAARLLLERIALPRPPAVLQPSLPLLPEPQQREQPIPEVIVEAAPVPTADASVEGTVAAAPLDATPNGAAFPAAVTEPTRDSSSASSSVG